ncbi:hypothetical protein DQ04_01801030 [Trypanosoma grayi]|uniref:hypothetical protein n=1 Tax=Trypanosoma grayi TaxID=71804 RepID=UPI0004F48735|nr:hypothetical protein DQ04_01801030 [Trypanosoma grayi]KEG12318.1 hypothetical protein DQ04_01801030 [Trypanosoma grayi]
MESIPPKTSVPDEWIHPALRQMLIQRGHPHNSSSQRIAVLEKQRSEIDDALRGMYQSLGEKKNTLQEMDLRRQRMMEEIEWGEGRISLLSSILKRLDEQIVLQKTSGTQELHDTSNAEDHQSPQCPLNVVSIVTRGQLTPCYRTDEATRRCFFSRYAPLFTLSDSPPMMAQRVTEPNFFDEACLMETDTDSCKNLACPYWHKDQLARVKLGVRHLISRYVLFTKGNSAICDASAIFENLSALIDAASSLVDAVRIQRDAVNCVVSLGWEKIFLLEDEEGEKEEGRKQIAGWETPLLPRLDKSLHHVTSLLRDQSESDMWAHIMCATSGPLGGATELFQKHSESLSWRCLMRVAGTTPDRLLWLATQGVALFPTSPSIQLSYVLALLRSGCAMSDCVDACIRAAQSLSAQAATLTLSQRDVQWSETAARYNAYMIAVTCIHVSETDANAATKLLIAVTDVPGRFCLLPLAQQNLMLMLVALQQTGRLEGASSLPLASISDVAFVLSEHFPSRPLEVCRQLLTKQLTLLPRCNDAGIDVELTEWMRSAIHLSLMRAFSVDAKLVDQVLVKSPMHSETGLVAIWDEYLRLLGQSDGVLSLLALVWSLLDSCQSPLLMVHFVQCLAFHGEDVEAVTNAFIKQFVGIHGLSIENIHEMATCDVPGVPSMEWIPFLILYSRRLCPRAQLGFLLGVPISLYCEVVELVLLLWLEALRASMFLQEDEPFHRCVAHGLLLLREPFLRTFSPIDCDFDNMISFAHVASLMVYRAVPVMLGAAHQLTAHYRQIVLCVSAELHVVHPFLLEAE